MTGWRFKLLYDGQCPFCRREIAWLRRHDRFGRLAFEDIATADFNPARYGLTRAKAMRVIHGVFPDGQVLRKMAAIRQAYQEIGLGWLLAPTGWPVLNLFADKLYACFARNRVAIGRFFSSAR